jgi:four helix bundle protein
LQELDETVYWLELIGDAGITSKERLQPLCDEAGELIAMFVTMVTNVKSRGRKARS